MDPMVWYQTIEHTDGAARVYSAPAIVTGRRHQGTQARDENDNLAFDDAGQPIWTDETVEVLSLTVFHPGRISFETNVEPYTDRHGLLGGSNSYRPWDSEPPEIDLS